MKSIFAHETQRPNLNKLATSVLCALTIGGLGTGSSDVSAAAREFVPGRIIVKPLPGVDPSEFSQIVGNLGGKSEKRLQQIGVHVIKVPNGKEEEFVELFAKHPHIAFAEKDMIVEPSVVPNDSWYSSEWHLPKIGAPAAWDYILDSSERITVAVLDTGVDATHPDLAGKLVAGWNVASGNSDTSPIAGHGTWVAGVIGAVNNNGLGVASVGGRNTLVQPVRVTDDSSGVASWSSLADGIVWAADHGAKVANLSYNMGWGCAASVLDSAAQYFRSKGGLVVASAGNDGVDDNCPDDRYLIIVSATDSNDAKPYWSNFGAFVDVAAPGAGIFTTAVGTAATPEEGNYSVVNGTSFSSPVTAGVIALMMAANPGLTPDQYEDVLKKSAFNIGGGARPNPYFGWGRVDAAEAVAKAISYVPTDTTPPTTAILSPGNGAQVAGTQVVSVSAQDDINVAKVEFYANNSLVGTSTTGPSYQFSWNTTTVADGDVPIYSYAYDNAGNRGASTVNTLKVLNNPPVKDSTPPTVAVTNPANNASVSGMVQVTVNASDNVALKQVQLQIDGKTVSTSNSSPLVYSWNTRKASKGSHSIKGIATDTTNLTNQSTISVTK